jgi:serine/threonine protein kinase
MGQWPFRQIPQDTRRSAASTNVSHLSHYPAAATSGRPASRSVTESGINCVVKPLQSGDPQRVGRYQLQGRLGAGGMGQVFLGQSPGGRLVAVKLIHAELAADPEFRARFAREVAAARQVSGIFTAAVVDADPDAPHPWLVTAYVPGPSLADAVDSQGPLPLTSVLTLAAGLAEGLGAIHAEGMVHRDLKPSNVLLASDGPRIIDFGISRAADATALTRANLVIGSPGFMSPEQALGQEVGPASDIFSLGAVLVFAATGEGPFGEGTVTALLYRVAHDPPVTDRLPGRIRSLVKRCLAKDPRLRPTTDEILAELGTTDSAANWLPQPVAQTLGGYAQPVPATAAEAPAPPGQTPPTQTPPTQVPPTEVPPTQASPTQAPYGPAPTTPVPLPGPSVPVPGPAGAMAGPPRVEPLRGPAASGVTTPFEWRPGPARPRPRRRSPGRMAAAGALVVVVLAGAGAALALTSRGVFGGQPTPPASSPAVPSPKAVVEAYFAAINAHDWGRVWNLGGKNLGQTYNQMVAGYRSTAHDVLASIHAHGDSVTVRLIAHETNGAVQTYRASYVVQGGVITAGQATLLGTS